MCCDVLQCSASCSASGKQRMNAARVLCLVIQWVVFPLARQIVTVVFRIELGLACACGCLLFHAFIVSTTRTPKQHKR
ncbi:hypothetical protein EV127DRAFT_432091 [Xylaria flabelliformis]|nr:hypothetical protein EV127DRAFT_432091 [Xylaria flabelliformis]